MLNVQSFCSYTNIEMDTSCLQVLNTYEVCIRKTKSTIPSYIKYKNCLTYTTIQQQFINLKNTDNNFVIETNDTDL